MSRSVSCEEDEDQMEDNDGYESAETRSACASAAEISDNQKKPVEVNLK